MLGRNPIVDFDGTLVKLPVDWSDLRCRLEVERMSDLWRRQDSVDDWELVAAAEAKAALAAEPIDLVVAAVERAECFSVLSSTSERAVEAFLERRPNLERWVREIQGRESLGGPKTEFGRFETAFNACVQAMGVARGSAEIVYAGDRNYELDFASRLGARVVDVRLLE